MTLACFIIANWTEFDQMSPFSHEKWMQCSNFYVIPGLVAFHYVQFGSLNNVRETEHNFQVISICVTDKGEASKSSILFSDT